MLLAFFPTHTPLLMLLLTFMLQGGDGQLSKLLCQASDAKQGASGKRAAANEAPINLAATTGPAMPAAAQPVRTVLRAHEKQRSLSAGFKMSRACSVGITATNVVSSHGASHVHAIKTPTCGKTLPQALGSWAGRQTLLPLPPRPTGFPTAATKVTFVLSRPQWAARQ